MRTIYWHSYLQARHDNARPKRAFQRRDAIAALGVVAALLERHGGADLHFGGPVFDYDESGMDENDIILQTTRPPLHDQHTTTMKRIDRSGTELERDVLAVAECEFLFLDRERVALHKQKGATFFRQRGAFALTGEEGTTRCYALRGRLARGPELVALWGMDGMGTLAFSRFMAQGEGFRKHGLLDLVTPWAHGRTCAWAYTLTPAQEPSSAKDLMWLDESRWSTDDDTEPVHFPHQERRLPEKRGAS